VHFGQRSGINAYFYEKLYAFPINRKFFIFLPENIPKTPNSSGTMLIVPEENIIIK